MEETRRRYPAGDPMHLVAPVWAVRRCQTYRDACRLAWSLRSSSAMSHGDLAAVLGVSEQAVEQYLSPVDLGELAELPARRIQDFNDALGNTAVTQWVQGLSNLACVEEHLWQHKNPDLIPTTELKMLGEER